MTRPLLPPRGIFVPTWLIYHRDIPSGVFHTWVQLRGLAWGTQETPTLSMEQLEYITGRRHSTVYEHMGFLRDRGALRWRPAQPKFTVVFFPGEQPFPEIIDPPESAPPQSENLDLPYPPLSTNIYTMCEEEKRGGRVQKSGLLSENLDSPAADIYQELTHIRTNPAQRRQLLQVSDSSTWRASVQHWLEHGWNPRNLPGMLELYQRGGPSACRSCSKAERPANSQSTLAALRQEYHKEIPNDHTG